MHALRNLSPRPELVFDSGPRPDRVVDPQTDTVGVPGPLTRGRMIKALPLADGPRQLVAPLVVQGVDLGYLGDPDGNLIGAPGQWVSRMVTARWTEDTRRLGG